MSARAAPWMAGLFVGLVACGPSEAPPEAPVAGLAAPKPQAPSPEAQEALRAAAELSRRGNLEAALERGRQALAAAPGWESAYRLVSKLYTELGRSEEAVSLFEALARAHPDRWEPWFYRGFHLFHLNRWPEAKASFREAARRHPSHAETHHRLALIHQYMGEFDDALAEARRARVLDPSSPAYAAHLSEILRIHGEYEDAGRVVQDALQANPGHPELQVELARIALHRGDEAAAETALRQALEQDPTRSQAHQDLAEILFRRGEAFEARWHLAQARRYRDQVRWRTFLMERLASTPGNAGLALRMAELELAEGRPEAAGRWFQHAASLGAPETAVRAGLAEALAMLGRLDQAERMLQGLPAEAPEPRLARSRLALAQGRPEQARRELDRALVAAPRDRTWLRRAADLLTALGDREAALRLLEEAAKTPRGTS